MSSQGAPRRGADSRDTEMLESCDAWDTGGSAGIAGVGAPAGIRRGGQRGQAGNSLALRNWSTTSRKDCRIGERSSGRKAQASSMIRSEPFSGR